VNNKTPQDVIATMNVNRDHRKQQLESELLGIQMDELVENAITRGSWFRENFNLAPETSSFWTALPRYVNDCVKIPPHVSGTLVQLYMQQAIQKYRNLFK
jgi:hypothetical protein